ncbi:MAG: transporter substrate-binding domain-containing protein [Salinivirgaceae bacterium]
MKIPFLIIAFLILLGRESAFCSREQVHSKTIKVGVYNNPPKVFLDKRNQPSGIFIDLLSDLAETEKLHIEYVSGTWAQLFELLQKGAIDVMPDVAFSEERDSLFLFSMPVINSWLQVFTMHETAIHVMQDLNNKRVGVLRGSIQEDFLNQTLLDLDELNFELITFNDYASSAVALKENKVDALVANRFFYFSDLCDAEIMPTGLILQLNDLHFAFAKTVDRKLIKLFNQHMSNLKNTPESAYYKSLNKWFTKKTSNLIPRFVYWILAGIAALLFLVTVFAIILKMGITYKTKELQLKNKELLKAKEAAESSDRLKTIFLQNMSHEIRTPMSAILGFLSLLEKNDLESEKRSQYLDVIQQSGQRLLSTLNDIMEISKIETGQKSINPEPVNVVDTLKYLHKLFNKQVSDKNLGFELAEHIDTSRATIETDKNMLEGMLTNLISNALKFTEKGSITMGNYLENKALVFYVKDTGIGIPKDRHEAIFDRFVQADLNMTRSHEGSGLGLSIVKAYLTMLGGNIWLESTPGLGSTFFFSIPYKPLSITSKIMGTTNPMELKSDKKNTILIVEDDPYNSLFIKTILENPNMDFLSAVNGMEAVQMVQEHPEISLVLMDLKMPLLNGIDATRKIREFNTRIPIIAQTAYALSGDDEKALEAGCNDYISKPIDKDVLIQVINKYL